MKFAFEYFMLKLGNSDNDDYEDAKIALSINLKVELFMLYVIYRVLFFLRILD